MVQGAAPPPPSRPSSHMALTATMPMPPSSWSLPRTRRPGDSVPLQLAEAWIARQVREPAHELYTSGQAVRLGEPLSQRLGMGSVHLQPNRAPPLGAEKTGRGAHNLTDDVKPVLTTA
eukprot:scaffold316287_cov32-Tisochrysis_lutea.AAC.3